MSAIGSRLVLLLTMLRSPQVQMLRTDLNSVLVVPRDVFQGIFSSTNEGWCASYGFPGCSFPNVFSSNIWFPVTFLSALVLSLLLFPTLVLRRPGSPADDRNSHEMIKALKVLLMFVTPTRSIWPSTYLDLARRAVTSRCTTIKIPLHLLVNDIISGKVELRNSRLDLSDLIKGSFRMDDWSLQLSANWLLWVEVSKWIFVAHVVSAKGDSLTGISSSRQRIETMKRRIHSRTIALSRICNGQKDNMSEIEIPLLAASRWSQLRNCLCLDEIPYSQLESSTRRLQSRLSPGQTVAFKFTTRCPSVSFLSTSFVLCALPFLPRRHARMGSLPEPSSDFSSSTTSFSCFYALRNRTTSPLLGSLSHFLELVTSGPAAVVVQSVQNASEEYADFLDTYVRNLEDDPHVREDFVRKWGIEGWREERFFASWEAALFSAKLLEHWVVVAHK
ncbi:hypothetical protein AcW1_006217 [Taiwanofungus camphoratus]|nr:hypothetical protein AcW2_004975 [Antrodia cinnamomea]KAI0934818.1 hypothetical protein AcV5_006535 [Antrodia cinnamomea]KAI0949896.1 hypothetical protein AcV7_008531 [Antrodia cinnamomea]KAI0958016.1 hypothetical protein AcW1_006217 [Antrodia cinnamomea]